MAFMSPYEIEQTASRRREALHDAYRNEAARGARRARVDLDGATVEERHGASRLRWLHGRTG
ncbi:MAG: hypothetical protein WD058_09180 [Dehalococcoidia bacterium]